MGRRFSNIKRGAQLYAALQKYVEYLSTPKEPNLNSRGPREKEYVVVFPYGFGSVGQNGTKILVTRPARQTLSGDEALIRPENKCAVFKPTDDAIRLRGFTPAKVICLAGSRNVDVETSKFTGLRYLAYRGLLKFTSPFGRAVETDRQFEARNAIRAEFLRRPEPIKRVSFVAEQRKEY